MLTTEKIEISGKTIEAIVIPLQTKNLLVLRGAKGYIMCGYLDLSASDKFNDVAVKVTGVSSIEDVLKAQVNSCSAAAAKLGIHQGQPIKEVLEIIA